MKKLNSKTLQNELKLISKKIGLASNNIEINTLAENFIASLLDAEFVSLWFYEESEMILIRERANIALRTISLNEKKGIIYNSFMTKEPKIYNYLASDKDYVAALDNPDNIKIKSKIILPLMDGEQFVGIVTAYNSIKKVKKFTQDDMEILKALAPYLIDIFYKMHPCDDADCNCRKRKKNEAEFLTMKEMKKIEASQNIVESSDTTLSSMANFIHDIRTPANTLQGFLELLEQQITDKRLKEYLINAKESAAFINELTTSMLDRISLHRERETSHTKVIDSNKFFANIAEMFASNMYEKRIEYNIFIDPLLPKSIEVDELKLKRVLMNLIGNAYKFTPYNKAIEFGVKYNSTDKTLHISIKDQGIGIAKDKQSQIFEAFKQAEDNTSLEYGGTGLGLSICASYVDELGGKLELKSELEKGSDFFFTLPVKVINEEPSFSKVENKNLKITFLVSPKNSSSVFNIARYLVRMNIDKSNILAVSSVDEIPKDTTHLIVYENKLDMNEQSAIFRSMKVLIVEEKLFSMNEDEMQEGFELISQYSYYANKLYKFINSQIPKVLIVDDDKISVLLLEKIFEGEYCEVDIARNGKIALEMIIESHKKGSPYSVIYIDNNMPLMTGIEVMKNVREFERDNKLTPIYAVSTSGNILDLETNGQDFNEYVGKPFKVAEIRKILYSTKEK